MNKSVGSFNRQQYLIWNALIVLVTFIFGYVIDPVNSNHTSAFWTVVRVIFIVLFVLFLFVSVARRINNVGWDVWWSLVILLPIAGLLFWLALFFIPPKPKKSKK
jgi:uncharacterized membrane protein YhaH (DUF805 family)